MEIQEKKANERVNPENQMLIGREKKLNVAGEHIPKKKLNK